MESNGLDQLFNRVQKSDGIVSTFTSKDILEQPETVQESYSQYAETHVSIGDTGEFEEKIHDKVVNGETRTTGYVYGPYGYGKTSTVVNVWNNLQKEDIVTVPPFTVTSFSDIMDATYGWIKHEFEVVDETYQDDLDEIYTEYNTAGDLEAYAEEHIDEYPDVDSPEELASTLEVLQRSGDFDPEVSANALIDFFEECTALVLEAGFDGLVVIGDELHQYTKQIDQKKANTQLRDLALGLFAHKESSPQFGLFFSMPEQTMTTLDAQAEDILNRLQTDNLVKPLTSVYGRDFPKQLWERYVEKYDIDGEDVITDHALEAAGQICVREDLSSGPRTIVDIIIKAIQGYREENRQFTALELANSFHSGQIRFDGNNAKIETAISDALSHGEVDTPEKKKFIKLCGVFPEEGVSEEVLDEYDLHEAKEALSKNVHGTLIKSVPGYTLVDVSKDEGPEDVMTAIIRKFWKQYEIDQPNAERAFQGFVDKVIEENLFDTQSDSAMVGWTVEDQFTEDHTNVFTARYRGTFDNRYPERIASIGVASGQQQEKIRGNHKGLGEKDGPDFAMNFVLHWQVDEGEIDERIEKESDREFTLHLTPLKTFDKLPGNLNFLRDAMDPKEVTPFLLLALVEFLAEDDTQLEASQEASMEQYVRGIVNQSIDALFTRSLIDNSPEEVVIRRAGANLSRGIFRYSMEAVYPEYSTLVKNHQRKSTMNDYQNFIEGIAHSARRKGLEQFEMTEDELLDEFGLGSWKSLETRFDTHYVDLIEYEREVQDDDPNKLIVQIQKHPLEEMILDEVGDDDGDHCSIEKAEAIGSEGGYLKEEVDFALDFLESRGLVEVKNGSILRTKTDVDADEVQERLEECNEKLDIVESYSDVQIASVRQDVRKLESRLSETDAGNEEKLDAINADVSAVEKDVMGVVERAVDDLQEEAREFCRTGENESPDNIPRALTRDITGKLSFIKHLSNAKQDAKSEYKDLMNEFDDLLDEAKGMTDAKESVEGLKSIYTTLGDLRDDFEALQRRKDEIDEKKDLINDWQKLADDVASLYKKAREAREIEGMNEVIDELDELDNQILESLLDDADTELGNIAAREEELESIRREYNDVVGSKRDAFEQKKESLGQILKDAGGSNKKLRRIKYDESSKEESKRNLIEAFREAYRSSVIDELRSQISVIRREIGYARATGVAEAIDDVDPSTIEEQTTELEERVEELSELIEDTEYTTAHADELRDASELGEQAKELVKDARSFNEERSPSTEQQKQLLERLKSSSGGASLRDIIKEKADEEGAENVDVDELMEAVAELFRLNQANVKIESRGRR